MIIMLAVVMPHRFVRLRAAMWEDMHMVSHIWSATIWKFWENAVGRWALLPEFAYKSLQLVKKLPSSAEEREHIFPQHWRAVRAQWEWNFSTEKLSLLYETITCSTWRKETVQISCDWWYMHYRIPPTWQRILHLVSCLYGDFSKTFAVRITRSTVIMWFIGEFIYTCRRADRSADPRGISRDTELRELGIRCWVILTFSRAPQNDRKQMSLRK